MEDFVLERSKSVQKDATRWTLIIPKIIMQGLSLWPEDNHPVTKFLSFCLLINIFIMLSTHTAYFIENITDIVKMAELLATVNISLQSFVRICTMIYYKKDLNKVLKKIWYDFWPSSTLNAEDQANILGKTKRYFTGVMSYCIAATCTTLQFMYQPLVLGIRSLPLMLKLPFPFLDSPKFEILYVWNAISCMSIQFSVIGFDFLFTMLVWNCAMQFKILRKVMEELLFENEQNKATDVEKIVRCIKYHNKLVEICEDMENMFRYILLIQLLDSAMALCVCCFAAVTVPSLFAKMMTFMVMYLLQLFLYCSFGNELSHQSMTLAYAAFRCGWHYTGNQEVVKRIMLLIQKSQKGQFLTARGFAVVNYGSCMQVIRMAFSIYTVLDNMKAE